MLGRYPPRDNLPNQWTTGRKKANRDNYEVDEATGCWIWLGAITSRGYGALKVYGQTISAHVYHYAQKYGPVPRGKELDHAVCDNPICCNPDHLKPVPRRINRSRSEEGKERKKQWNEGVPF